MDPTPRLRLLRRIALASAVLALAVVAASSWLRLHDASQSTSVAEAGVRLAHRVAASAMLVLALLGAAAAATQGVPRRDKRLAFGLLALVLCLAVLGAATGRSHATPVVAANAWGGAWGVWLSCALAVQAPATQAQGRRLLLALLSLQAVLVACLALGVGTRLPLSAAAAVAGAVLIVAPARRPAAA